jgi:hypothetical protein
VIETAETIGELGTSLARDFERKGIAQPFANEFAQALVSEFAIFEVPTPRRGTLSLLVGHYAIRKDDLKLFEVFADGLKAAAGVAFFVAHQPVLATNIAIGVALARLVRTLMTRGATLGDATIWVLTILRCNVQSPRDPGLSPTDILDIVKRTMPEANIEWVTRELWSLREVPVRDGSSVKLASEDSSGRWRPHV